MENTLLVAASYEPLTIVHWKRAIALVLLEKVEILEAYSRVVRSPSLSL